MQPLAALLPLGVALVGASGALFAQTLDGAGTNTGTVFSGSILAASVGALVWVTKQFANGKLVARDPDTVEERLIGLVESFAETMTSVQALVEKSHDREREYLELLRSGTRPAFDPEKRGQQ